MSATPFQTLLPRGSRKAEPGIDPTFASDPPPFERETVPAVILAAARATGATPSARRNPQGPSRPIPAAPER